MKKISLIIYVFILVVTLMACNISRKFNYNNLKNSTYEFSKQSKEVLLSIKEKTITNKTKSITLVLTNNSNKKYIYGEELCLELKLDNSWRKIPRHGTWHDIAVILSPNECNEITVSLDEYSKLDSGNYRIIKDLHSNEGRIFTIAEFQIQ